MRVLLSTYGSRGDVEPMAALAAGLQALGAEAVLCAPPDRDFVELAARAGVRLVPAFMPVRQWIAERTKPSAAEFPKLAAEMMSAQIGAIGAAAEGCDAIVATGLMPSAAAAQCVAELRSIPYRHASFCPLFLPSHHHRPFAYPGHPLAPEVTDNRVLWDRNIGAMDALFGEAINGQRAAIGLTPTENVRDLVFTNRPLLASDAVLWPWRETDLCAAVQTGAWILPDERSLPADLTAFLERGRPPVYLGYGSISIQTAKDAASVAVAAIRALGRRMVIASGWAELAPVDGDDCCMVGEINQQALFGRVAAVIHHGGAGTTTTAARAGAPQVIVPQIVDQPFWAGRVADLGIGAAHDGPAPSGASLSAALGTALAPETGRRAEAVADTIRTDGAATAARLLLDEIGRERPRDHA